MAPCSASPSIDTVSQADLHIAISVSPPAHILYPSPMSDESPEPTRSPNRVVRWGVFLGATAFIVYLCSLVLAPFLDVFAWSAILSIAFHPVYRRLVRVTGRASLSAFLCSVLVVVVSRTASVPITVA